MKEENNRYQADDNGLSQKVALQRSDCRADQSGAVVAGLDLNSIRQRWRDLCNLAFHAVDHVQSVLAVAHHDNAAYGFSFTLPLRDPFPDIGAETHRGEVAQHHRSAVFGGHRDVLQVGKRTQIAQPADHVARAIHFQHASAHFIGAGAHTVDHARKGNAVGEQLVGIELDLILADKSADGRHFSDSRHGRQLIAKLPILNAPQIGQAMRVVPVNQRVLKYPARPGRIGTKHRFCVRRQPTLNGLQVFENARTRPIEISAVLKDDINVGIGEHRLRANGFDVRCRKQVADDGVSDLVLDHIWWLPRPRGVHDDLHIGDVGQGVKRHLLDGPQAANRQQCDRRENKEAVGRAPVDQSGDHGYMPPLALMVICRFTTT